jgi:hypothetical protein
LGRLPEQLPGEKLFDGGYVVKDIGPDSVILQSLGDDGRRVVVRIEDETVKKGKQP